MLNKIKEFTWIGIHLAVLAKTLHNSRQQNKRPRFIPGIVKFVFNFFSHKNKPRADKQMHFRRFCIPKLSNIPNLFVKKNKPTINKRNEPIHDIRKCLVTVSSNCPPLRFYRYRKLIIKEERQTCKKVFRKKKCIDQD